MSRAAVALRARAPMAAPAITAQIGAKYRNFD
jgi:hypothetical protein